MLSTCLLLSQVSAPTVKSLDDYLKLDTGKPSWSAGPKSSNFAELRLNGLTWQGDAWRHEIVVAGAKISSDVAILNLTGDRMENKMDDFTIMFSKTCKLPVVTVYGVPNQPTFGLREDELISYGIRQFLMTKDNTWPLLLPMTKSAIHAMDAIQEWSNGRLKKFIVTGTSKRGATSWLVASSGDPRVIGIVPTVADLMIDMPNQLNYQKAVWGHYTPMIPEFKAMDPVPFLSMPRGKEMMTLVDPYLAMPRVNVPALVICGGNDQFTVLDSTKLYWNQIKGPKLFKMIPSASHFFAIPNARHDGYSEPQSLDLMRAVRFFADCITGTDKRGLPAVNGTRDPRQYGSKIWSVSGGTRWLNERPWEPKRPSAQAKATGTFEEVFFRGNGYTASFTTPVTLGPLPAQ
ncbi:MAG: PhoPQ-activated protein PqaA family protein [Fimbriimonadaceae bacterium]